ncbi:MAG: sugar phosphate isomerase/epimerase [Chloroflexi bacterium]|nr:sugar phosphate isomerase/epimerase [Chloroflexota bacterium]
MDQVSITAKHTNFEACYRLAIERGLGIELQTFAFPPVLDSPSWDQIVEQYKQTLRGFPYPISMHGAFMDMAPGSPDTLFITVTRERTYQFLRLAAELKAGVIVFHANFIAAIRDDEYRMGWTDRMIEFFVPVVDYARELGVNMVLENMWEFDPSIIRFVLDGVNSTFLSACLDVGHAYLFSKIPFVDWLEDLQHWITYIHMNNNYADIDLHLGLDDGVLDYEYILPLLRNLPNKPQFVLEIEDVHDQERSLAYFELEKPLTG